MSKRKDIIKQAGVLLNTGRPAGIPVAVQSRSKALKTESLPAITFYPKNGATHPYRRPPGEESRPPLNIDPKDPVLRDLLIHVECTGLANEATGIRMDDAVDDLSAWVIAALCGGDWGGLVTNCTHEGSEFDYENREGPMGGVTEFFRVWYLTAAGSLTA